MKIIHLQMRAHPYTLDGEMGMQPFFSKVKARSLLCYWAVRKQGISLSDSAEHLEMSASVPGVGFAVERVVQL